jgi:ABC-2 type transport system permease protein
MSTAVVESAPRRPGRTRTLQRIAREELRWLWRNGLTRAAALLMLALLLTATLAAVEQRNAQEAARARVQAASDQAFLDQPERHPHRVVHYGQFALRPLGPLAFFDFGLDAYSGRLLYLEGHRQNSANFGDARQSSLLLRFGQLSPAFVLQLLAPLLIVFLAHAAVARERSGGSLRALRVQGLSLGDIVLGKLLAHSGVALALAAPALLALLIIGAMHAAAGAAALLALLYALYLLGWVLLALLASLLAPRPREALLAGLSLWVVMCVALPRLGADTIAAATPLPTRVATDIGVQKALAAIGDSHNPNDPHFSAFREAVLQRYGVERIEDLPVNFSGIVMQEGERLTSELFAQQAAAVQQLELTQSAQLAALGWISPLLALRPASMRLAGSDPDTQRAFLAQAEAHRYAFVQALNVLHAEKIQHLNDRDQKLSTEEWKALPRFEFIAPARALNTTPLAALRALGLWLLLPALLLKRACARMETRP